jgi:hypothetical protein
LEKLYENPKVYKKNADIHAKKRENGTGQKKGIGQWD